MTRISTRRAVHRTSVPVRYLLPVHQSAQWMTYELHNPSSCPQDDKNFLPKPAEELIEDFKKKLEGQPVTASDPAKKAAHCFEDFPFRSSSKIRSTELIHACLASRASFFSTCVKRPSPMVIQ